MSAMSAPARDTVDALLAACALKDLPRAGWARVGVPAPESVAAHSWGVAHLVLWLLPLDLDLGRALAYAALHDLAEATVGDITPHDGVGRDEKIRREREAIAALLDLRPALRDRWEAYEARADREAAFVHELDRLDMAVQALAYHRRGAAGMAAFVASAARVVRHPTLTPLLDVIRTEIAGEIAGGDGAESGPGVAPGQLPTSRPDR
jgi:putative hydrolase of HD superfamily